MTDPTKTTPKTHINSQLLKLKIKLKILWKVMKGKDSSNDKLEGTFTDKAITTFRNKFAP